MKLFNTRPRFVVMFPYGIFTARGPKVQHVATCSDEGAIESLCGRSWHGSPALLQRELLGAVGTCQECFARSRPGALKLVAR